MNFLNHLSEKQLKERIAWNLRRLRKKNKLSFGEVARRAKTYPPAIKELEETYRMPSVWMLVRLSIALGADISDFFKPIRNLPKKKT